MRNIAIMGIALATTLFGNACMNSVNTVENKDKTMQPQFVVNKRVVTDGYLRDRLHITRVDKARSDTGLLKIQVSFRSDRVSWLDSMFGGDEPYKIGYRFTWFDKDGMQVDTATNTWLEKDIVPGDIDFISSIAPNERCEDFVLRMREM